MGWQSATVTFDPRQHSSRRMSMKTERRMSTVTFDPMSSSHGNRSPSERRGSDLTLDPGYHDDTALKRRMATVTFDDALGSCHDNGQISSHNERPLTSELGILAAEEDTLLEEMGREKGGGEGDGREGDEGEEGGGCERGEGDEGGEREGGEGDEGGTGDDRGVLAQQSAIM